MNSDQLSGIVRQVLMMFSGWAIGLGFTNQNWELVAGAAGAIIAVAWSLFSNSYLRQVDNVTKSADVHEVLVNPGMALATDNPKVVARRTHYGNA